MLEGDVQGQRRGTRTSEHGAIPIGVQAEPGPVLVGRSSYVRQAVSLESDCTDGPGTGPHSSSLSHPQRWRGASSFSPAKHGAATSPARSSTSTVGK